MGRQVTAIVVLLTLCLAARPGWGQTGTVEEAEQLNRQLLQLYQQGHYVEDARLGERALAIWEKVRGPEHPHTAMALTNLAGSYRGMGEVGKVLPFYQRALAIWEKLRGPEHPHTARAFTTLAVLYESIGEPTQALRFWQRGLATEPRTLATILAVASEAQKLQFVERSRGPYLAALSLIHRRFPRDAPAVRVGLELVLWRKGIVLEAQSQAQNALVAHLEGQTRETWQQLTQHRSTLARLLLRGPGTQSLADYRHAMTELSTAIAQEEEFLAQRSGLLAQALVLRQVTAPMVAERLPRDGALVEFARIRDWDEAKKGWADTQRYLAFVLTPDTRVVLVDLGEAARIDAAINKALTIIGNAALRQNLQAHARQGDAVLSELYGLLLQPLEPAIGSRQRLIVSPDGELNKVPFAALRTPDGHYLVEQRTLSYVASGRDLLRGKTGVAPTVDLVLVANPAFDDRAGLHMATLSAETVRAVDFAAPFAPLPGTAAEARTIPPLLKGTRKQVLEGKQATESAVRAVQSPRILHLATHGFFLRDEELPLPERLTAFTWMEEAPKRGVGGVQELPFLSGRGRPTGAGMRSMVRSGLALAGANHASTITSGDDGLLTALEVSGMNLYGTDLVVLSACQTAVGDVRIGEEVYGLRRAFVLAGARNLVMSLWPVNDQVTLTQMQRFYQAYGQGASPAEALRQAQLQTITELRARTKKEFGEALAPVRLWAPFMVQQTGE
jgi:CHAT domain-containing protein